MPPKVLWAMIAPHPMNTNAKVPTNSATIFRTNIPTTSSQNFPLHACTPV
jgi:hypothetical protein